MALSSVSVVTNALRLRRVRATMAEETRPAPGPVLAACQPAE
jgi:Cu+-exporting ATPase